VQKFLCHQEKQVMGTHKDIAHPITNELRQHIEEKVITAYNEKTGENLTLARKKK
jgi:DNA-binding cell septation regulator SpoVG